MQETVELEVLLSTFIHNNFYLFCASRAGDTFPDEGKGIRKVRPEEGSASQARRKICWRKLAAPYGNTPPAPTGGKVGAGECARLAGQ